MKPKLSIVSQPSTHVFAHSEPTRFHRFAYRIIGEEVSRVARHADGFCQAFPLPHDSGLLLESVSTEAPKRVITSVPVEGPTEPNGRFEAVLLNGNLNFEADAQKCLERVKKLLTADSRLLLVLYNPYIRPLFRFLNWLGLRNAPAPTSFLTVNAVNSIARLAGFELVRTVPILQFPFSLFGLGRILNTLLSFVPLVRWSGIATVSVLRPLFQHGKNPTLSIVVPIRNEKGNLPTIFSGIEALNNIPKEVIFVEGHSTDGTWEALKETLESREFGYPVRALKQKGKGKKDASLLGLSEAQGDVLTILDGDMTVTTEALAGMYRAYCSGLADFVNGSRLIYDMEEEAMRPLNRLGNVFFAKALSFVLGVRLSDTLCGSKMLSRAHFRAVQKWNRRFGDFDPFGDFALLFAASSLGLSVVDVPVHYLARRYGSTNISRFRDGWQLLRMTTIGFFRIKLGRG